MRGGSIGRRYAKALLDLAIPKNQVDVFLGELEKFDAILKASPDLNFLMTDSAFEASERKKALEVFVQKLGLSQIVHQFLKLLIDRERIVFFPEILRAYRSLADEFLGRVRVQVTLADEMGPDSQEKLKGVLEKKTGKKALLEFQNDPQILGGIVIQIQDKVYDGSVRAALASLKEKMIQAV